MADESHDELLLIGRLVYAETEVVCKELEKYGKRLQSDSLEYPTEALEEALLSRHDPTINFALARYGGTPEIIRSLYELSGTDPDDDAHAVYLRALRVGVLSNRSCTGFLSYFPSRVIGQDETDRLIRSGNHDEIYALFTNPIIETDLLANLFKGKEIFSEIEDRRRRTLIAYAGRNSRLSDDQSNEHGPDMGHYDIHKAIVDLFVNAPAEQKWFITLEQFLSDASPFSFHSPDTAEQARQIVDKWRGFTGSDDSLRDEGFYTDLDNIEEFQVSLASRFGYHASKETGYTSVLIGSPDSQSIVDRAAYYGTADMTTKEMDAALAKDGSAFSYAALQNMNIFMKASKRLFLEEHCIRGYQAYVYKKRCEQLAESAKYFDPRPVSDWMKDDDDFQVEEPDETKPQWAHGVDDSLLELAKGLVLLGEKIDSVKLWLGWVFGFIVVVAASIFF